MEKLELFCSVDGNGKWYSHCGIRCGNSSKIKDRITTWSRILLLGIHSKALKAVSQRVICTTMFTAALFITTKMWKQPKCPSTHDQRSKLWHIHTIDYYSALKRKEILTHATT